MLGFGELHVAAGTKRALRLPLGLALAIGASALVAPSAHAHIAMEGALMSRGGDIKNVPCDGKRGDGPIYTFEPGTTITLSVNEYIPHPSYYRVSFDPDGEDFVEPASIDPIDPNRAGVGQKCLKDPNDKCGKADYCNSPTVLWDNLDAHASGAANPKWNIKLPDVECDNCTLQIIQVMEDSSAHGAYCPLGSCSPSCSGASCDVGGLQDVYHVCIDMKLKKGATNSPGTTTMPVNAKGMECKAGAPPATNTGDAGTGMTSSSSDAGQTSSGGATGHDASTGSTGSDPTAPNEPTSDAGHSTTTTDGTGTSGTTGAGTKPATGSKDAGTAKADASTGSASGSSSTSDNAEEPSGDSGGGCAVSGRERNGSSALLSLLLAFGVCALARRRARAR